MRKLIARLWGGIAQSFLGTAMLVYVENLRDYVAWAPSLPRNQDRAEVRLQASFITAAFLLLLAEPIFYIFFVPDALISRVSSIAYSRWCVVGAFGLAFAAALPHLFTLIFKPDILHRKCFRTAAAWAAIVAACTWMVLANRAVRLDVGGLEWAYGIRAMVSLFIGGIFAFSVNAQQMRETFDAASR